MPNFNNSSQEASKLNTSDIASEFESLKISVLQKARRVSGNLNQVSIGPNSTFSYDDFNESEKKENTQNSCNIPETEKNKLSENPGSTRSGITFSIKKILYENELQRKELVRKKMRKRIEEMERSLSASRAEIEIYHAILSVQREKERKDELAQLEAEEERQAQQMEIRRKHEQQLLAQRIKEQKEKLERDAEEQRKKAKDQEEMLKIQNNFHDKCRDFESLTNSCKEKYMIEPYIEKIHEFRSRMETIGNVARSGRLSIADFEFAKVTVQNIEEVLRHFKIEIERINAIYDARIAQREQELEEAKALQLQEIIQNTETQQQVLVPETRGVEVTDSGTVEVENIPSVTTENTPEIQLYEFIDKESLQMYDESDKLVMCYKEKYDMYIKSSEGKQFRSQSQKKIINPINALSLQNREVFIEQYEKLKFVLSGNLSSDPRADAFIKNLVATQIISQGETVVSSKPEAAFPIAAVAVALWNDFPEFGNILLANFRVTCPFIIPAFFPQLTGQSDKDYYKSLGCKYNEDGTVEDHMHFLKRITGVMRLYASIIITRKRQGVTQHHPHGLQFAWRWLAAILNKKPQKEFSDIYATLIEVVLEITGHYLWEAYPNQFPKLLTVMITAYYPLLSQLTGINGPICRFEEFLKKCLSTRTIAPPKGELPPNYW